MKLDWITIIAIALMVLGFSLLCLYYYAKSEESCQGNPLLYGAKMYEEQTGLTFSGTGRLIGVGYEPIIINFDSNNVSID